MENLPQYHSYKKLIVFGAIGVGKTTLTESIEKGKFIESITHSENHKFIHLI